VVLRGTGSDRGLCPLPEGASAQGRSGKRDTQVVSFRLRCQSPGRLSAARAGRTGGLSFRPCLCRCPRPRLDVVSVAGWTCTRGCSDQGSPVLLQARLNPESTSSRPETLQQYGQRARGAGTEPVPRCPASLGHGCQQPAGAPAHGRCALCFPEPRHP